MILLCHKCTLVIVGYVSCYLQLVHVMCGVVHLYTVMSSLKDPHNHAIIGTCDVAGVVHVYTVMSTLKDPHNHATIGSYM